jgi:tripartite-type tricarboxylate transporter receptor subunit TctC
MPDVRERLEGLGLDPGGNTPDEFAAFQKAEIAKWAKVVKDGNIKAD